AEDGIRDKLVTGVQTCALPISPPRDPSGRRVARLPSGRPRGGGAAAGAASGHLPRRRRRRWLARLHARCWNRTIACRYPLETSKIGRASCRERVKYVVDDVWFK